MGNIIKREGKYSWDIEQRLDKLAKEYSDLIGEYSNGVYPNPDEVTYDEYLNTVLQFYNDFFERTTKCITEKG